MNIDVFLNQTLWELTDCLLWFIHIKIPILEDLKFEYITYQKEIIRIITSLTN